MGSRQELPATLIGMAAPAWRRDLLPLVAGLLLVLAWDLSGLDLVVAHWFGGPQGFAWRDHWLTRVVLHDGGRGLAWALLAALLINVRWPWIRGLTRAERLHWVGLTVVCLLAIPAIKRLSSTSCPWDLAEFGGVARYLSHWQVGLADGGPGHCFPSGHATAAFAFLSGVVVLRRARPDLARTWLWAVLAVGTLFGLAQLMRGAHYPSHTLWTAWGCWAICVIGAPRESRISRAPAALGPRAAGQQAAKRE
jgi:membrane-associated PAP2 superfamily phosphatase